MNLSSDEKCEQTLALVEADYFAQSTLWREWSSEYTGNNCIWTQDYAGMLKEVGKFHDFPVCVSVFWYIINGVRVGFYEDSSRVVDHNMIETWIEKTFKNIKCNTNATNFHHVIQLIENISKKKIEYKGPIPIWQK